jgi:hypothetical protein
MNMHGVVRQRYFAVHVITSIVKDLTTSTTATAITIALVTLVSPRAHENQKVLKCIKGVSRWM